MGTKEPKSKKAKVEEESEDDAVEEEEEEESDDNEDDDDDDDEDEDEEDDDDEDDKADGVKRNDEGDAYFDLSTNRRLVVRKFKGSVLVDVREFYEKDGKQLPGKKGISLSLDQYKMFRDLAKNGKIDKEIAKL